MPQRDNFYSEEVQAIMGKAPAWVVRWGITVVLAIFVGILVGCWFVKYPDLIEAPASITTINPPADLVAREMQKAYEGIGAVSCQPWILN